MRRGRSLFLLGALGALGACTSTAQFRSAFAEGAEADPRPVSFVGVLRDGQLKADGWKDYGERLLAPLGTCAPEYTVAFAQQNDEAAKALEKYTRANGISDELLDLLAKGADSDAIGVLEVAGQPPKVLSQKAKPNVVQPTAGMPGMGPKTGGTGSSYAIEDVTDGNAFVVVFSVYSAKGHQTIARLQMTYTGQELDEAIANFAAKVRDLFPGWSCAGWHPDVKLDVEALQKLP